ncbi:hypothetical protein DU52_14940 [Methanosarcina mazei]|uniref:Uncharacterized protein n=1 Tax=Methanosarcina mazei TaxID=2209 RepID=A0A0F8IE99_METMZ|nr:hypothetical protein DU52_14940 [Methanosarcina mazei]KKG35863.1 hypothetical protein DU30_15795 [Methanosarcina mazei]KKG60757.1 hypothetical protein DU67_14950 [Methanosarcina mazei]KKG77764.1 hypothetical protein DU43_12705 [Methanosarcina mazei]KKH25429.1 hypothetical protein DU58_02930 [Methanosarcina mazei]
MSKQALYFIIISGSNLFSREFSNSPEILHTIDSVLLHGQCFSIFKGKREGIFMKTTVKSILYKGVLDKRFIRMSLPGNFPSDHIFRGQRR